MNSTVRLVVFWLVITTSAFLLWQVVRNGSTSPKQPEIGYSEFLAGVESGKVEEITLAGNHLNGKYADGTFFHVTVPSSQEGMLRTLRQNKVSIFVRDEPTGDVTSKLSNFLPILILAAFWFYMIWQMKRVQSLARKTSEVIEPK